MSTDYGIPFSPAAANCGMEIKSFVSCEESLSRDLHSRTVSSRQWKEPCTQEFNGGLLQTDADLVLQVTPDYLGL